MQNLVQLFSATFDPGKEVGQRPSSQHLAMDEQSRMEQATGPTPSQRSKNNTGFSQLQ